MALASAAHTTYFLSLSRLHSKSPAVLGDHPMLLVSPKYWGLLQVGYIFFSSLFLPVPPSSLAIYSPPFVLLQIYGLFFILIVIAYVYVLIYKYVFLNITLSP